MLPVFSCIQLVLNLHGFCEWQLSPPWYSPQSSLTILSSVGGGGGGGSMMTMGCISELFPKRTHVSWLNNRHSHILGPACYRFLWWWPTPAEVWDHRCLWPGRIGCGCPGWCCRGRLTYRRDTSTNDVFKMASEVAGLKHGGNTVLFHDALHLDRKTATTDNGYWLWNFRRWLHETI